MAGGGNYNFEAMKNNDNRIDGGLTILDELYIPVNVDNTQRSFIQVTMHAKTIQLFNSQGKHDNNDRFLKAIKNYMYNTLTKNAEGERKQFGAWRQERTTTDEL